MNINGKVKRETENVRISTPASPELRCRSSTRAVCHRRRLFMDNRTRTSRTDTISLRRLASRGESKAIHPYAPKHLYGTRVDSRIATSAMPSSLSSTCSLKFSSDPNFQENLLNILRDSLTNTNAQVRLYTLQLFNVRFFQPIQYLLAVSSVLF